MSRAPTPWPRGHELIALDEVGSTLDEARARVLAGGIAAPTWIMARRQSAGRGRRGRAWHQGEGNLAATLVLPDPGAAARAAQRSFVSALALYDVFEGLSVAARLKWPNDVLVAGGKIAGILLEGLPAGALGIGIGVNLARAPSPGEVEAGALVPVALAGLGVEIGPRDFLTLLAGAYAAREQAFVRDGFAPIRRAWLARAAGLGENIAVRLPRETLTGRFADMDEEGRLVLSTARGPRHIAAGDVFFRGGGDASGHRLR